MSPASTQAFTVPPELSAAAPPEARGVPRDGVRLLVARPGRPLRHLVFAGLPGVLRRGDLLVVNDSDTEPAALDGHRADGRPVVLHVSGPTRRRRRVVVELRTPDGRRVGDGAAGEAVRLPGGVTAFLLAAHPDPQPPHGQQAVAGADPASRAGFPGGWRVRPPDQLPLPARTAAARRLPHRVRPPRRPRVRLRRDAQRRPPVHARACCAGCTGAGCESCALTLHTGVASLEAGEEPLPERYAVPATTAAAVNATRGDGRAGGRGRHHGDPRAGDGGRPGRRRARRGRAGPTWCWARTGPPGSSTGSSPAGTSPRRRTCCCSRRWPGADLVRPRLRRGAGPRLPLARVRRLLPAPALIPAPATPGSRPLAATADRSPGHAVGPRPDREPNGRRAAPTGRRRTLPQRGRIS